jgi:hypothetical protein
MGAKKHLVVGVYSDMRPGRSRVGLAGRHPKRSSSRFELFVWFFLMGEKRSSEFAGFEERQFGWTRSACNGAVQMRSHFCGFVFCMRPVSLAIEGFGLHAPPAVLALAGGDGEYSGYETDESNRDDPMCTEVSLR